MGKWLDQSWKSPGWLLAICVLIGVMALVWAVDVGGERGQRIEAASRARWAAAVARGGAR